VVMQWLGAGGSKDETKKKKPKDPIAFIGKGVTFDTGGISIKPAAGMEDMKWDMAGAGAVTGLMAALAGRRAKVDAVGLIGLVENMPSGTATRPGDVVTSYSGQTIEILNTDAEGRLVLADVLYYAQERFSPKYMVDMATLTGAIIVGLGHEYAGLFSNDDELADKLIAAGKATGEGVWRMPLVPLGESYDKNLNSPIADMQNIGGGRAGGSITAAQFLQRFVNGKPWAHLDIAGMAWASKDAPTTPKGATAFGVRLLDRWVADNFEG
jgi:leucyl aminopeptidase